MALLAGVVSEKCILLFICIIIGFISHSHCRKVAIKVVEEPSSYGMNFGGYQEPANTNTNTLKMRVPPSNFSGPPHLQRLVGKCFSKVQDSYKYEVCPFANVSQHEQSSRWNPYTGILGVWRDWEITNNTYTAMLLTDGDACGKIYRSVKVLFECGNNTSLNQVHEPKTCSYEMTFSTPLVCHKQSMLVYPTLSDKLRREWDQLETRLHNQEITQKGYDKLLRKLFEKAGLQSNSPEREKLLKEIETKEKEKENSHTGDFDTLYQCSEEYKKLQEEVKRLKSLLDTHNIPYSQPNTNDGIQQEFGPLHPETDYNDYHRFMDSMET